MPPIQGKSTLLSKLGDRGRKAHEAHKADPTEYGNAELPAGIEGGIAQLIDCKFDTVKPGKKNAGAYYFYAAASVILPKEHGGIPIEGQRTSIMEMLCDTPESKGRKTIEEHLAWVYNELRKLGVDTSAMSLEDLEPTATALKEAQPHLRFRTWKGDPTPEYPNPRVNHVWLGAIEFNDDSGAAPGVEDNSGSSPPAASANGTSTATDDLGKLATLADKGDKAAMKKLKELAIEAGAEEEVIDNAANWGEVKEMIENPAGGGKEGGSEAPTEEAPAEGEWTPAVEEVYKYAPMNPKTKKAGKAIEVEVTAVDEAKKTVDLAQLDNKKITYKKVPFDKLESASE